MTLLISDWLKAHIHKKTSISMIGLPRWHSGNESICQCRRPKRHGFDIWIRRISWIRKRQPTSIFLPGKYLGQEDPLEKVMASHSNILAQKIPWAEEPGGLQSMGLQRVRHDWVTKTAWCSSDILDFGLLTTNFNCTWKKKKPTSRLIVTTSNLFIALCQHSFWECWHVLGCRWAT